LPTGAVVVPLAGADARSSVQLVYRADGQNPLVEVVRSLVVSG